MNTTMEQKGSEGEGNTSRTTRDSMGWLAQSSVMPKRRKEIQGVSATSIIGLKAQLVKRQHEARSGERLEKKSRYNAGSLVENRSNPGVAERDRRDRLALKSTKDELEASRTALEKKAALYDHFAKGSLDNSSDQFEVDFASKRDLEHGHKRDSCTDDGDAFDTDTDGHDKKNGNGGDQRREVIDELEAQTRQGRVKAAAAKFERESFESKKRKRLKLEFLKRRLQKSKSSVHL